MVLAQGSGGSGGGSSGGSGGSSGGNTGTLADDAPNDGLKTGAYDVREDYRRANKLSIPFGPPTKRNPDGMDEVVKQESIGPGTVDHGGPVYTWPVIIPEATSAVPTKRDMGIMKHRMKTFGLPISDTQYQMIHRMNQQIMLEEMFDPERIMWLGACMGASQAQDSSNSFANMIRQQGASAIDYISCTVTNFTADKNNRWNKIRDQLFVPMAILLLLPGAVLAQVKVIVAAGMPLGGADVSPFEGIIRSIVAIFLIPATYLVVNYGIDLNNSLTITISENYERMFQSNMYKDALCTVIRAFPLRQAHENRNGIYKEVVPWQGSGAEGNTPAAGIEGRAFEVKKEDPCAGIAVADPDHADEQAPFLSVTARFFNNMSNAVLASTWNILCAFQVVFMMYLWLVGPVIAALWVYPHDTLRAAFGGWVEGVITLSFWGLFWNTTVLLMACFKGLDETGTIACSALFFLSLQSVKSAFDFAGLVKEAGSKAAASMNEAAEKMSQSSRPGVAGGGSHGGGKGGHAGGRAGGHGAAHGGSKAGGGHGGRTGGAAHSAAAGAGHGAGTMGSLTGSGHGGANLHVSGTVSNAAASHSAGVGHAAKADTSLSGHGAAAARDGGTGHSGGLAGTGAQGHGVSGVGGNQGERGVSGSDSSSTSSTFGMNAPSSQSGPVVPPGDINVSNSSSFNANNLTGTVDGANSRYSAAEASNLLGRENLANFPREGVPMSRQEAINNYNAAAKDVEMRNAFGNSDDNSKRNDLMDKWKSDLMNAEGHASADGKTIGLPDSMSGINAGGNFNVSGDSVNAGSGPLPPGFTNVFDNVSNTLQNASATIQSPGNDATSLNPAAVHGLTSLAREMTEVGPQLSGMSPQVQAATVESWNQRAEVFSQQLHGGSGSSPSESLQLMAADLRGAQDSMRHFKESYTGSSADSSAVGYSFTAQTYGGSGASDTAQSQSGYAAPGATGYSSDSSTSGYQSYPSSSMPSGPDSNYQGYGAGATGYSSGSSDGGYSSGVSGGASGYSSGSSDASGQGGFSSAYPSSSAGSYSSDGTPQMNNYQQNYSQSQNQAPSEQQQSYMQQAQQAQQDQFQAQAQAQAQADQQFMYQQQQAQQQADQAQQFQNQQQTQSDLQQQYLYQQQAQADQAAQAQAMQASYPQTSSDQPAPMYQQNYDQTQHHYQTPDAYPQQQQGAAPDSGYNPQSVGNAWLPPAQENQAQQNAWQTEAIQQSGHSTGQQPPSQQQQQVPQSHQQGVSLPFGSPGMSRSSEAHQGPAKDKPVDKPAAPQSKEKEAPRHAIDPMKFNPLKQKAPPKKKPEDPPQTEPPKGN